ncbi:hypothetical protein LINGRAHAP2_LOCUS3007, partial [Linum grandiflorum]
MRATLLPLGNTPQQAYSTPERNSSRPSMIQLRTKLNLVTSFSFAQQRCVYDLNVRSSLS